MWSRFWQARVLLFVIIIWLGLSGLTPVTASPAYIPRIITSDLDNEGYIIADASVADYGAIPDDDRDDTAAFARAIGDVEAYGGGVVFAPQGRYVFRGRLTLPQGVVLRGEWASPVESPRSLGTVLCVYDGKDSPDQSSFITLSPSSGVRNLTIWYPEQDYGSVHAYPWSISGDGMHNTVQNVTLINSYQGIRIGPGWEELHYIRNIYGTPLLRGIFIDTCSDVGRIMGVHFGPGYWEQSGLPGAPVTPDALGMLHTHLSSEAKGLILARADWEYVYGVSISGYAVGVQITMGHGPAPNGQFYDVAVDGARTALQVDQTLAAGFLFTNSSFRASAGPHPVSVWAGPLFSGVIAFNHCTFGGTPHTALENEGSGMVTLQNCVFEDWGYAGGKYAITAQAGLLTVEGSRFAKNKPQASLGFTVGNACFLGNVVPGKLHVDRDKGQKVIIDETPRRFPDVDAIFHAMPVDHPYVATRLFVVRDPLYGAKGDGRADDTAAIQRALDAAGLGGGIVYLPAGEYRLEGSLSVPEGVELRGSWDVPHHTQARGTVLLAYGGRGEADGEPLICLSSGSGVYGLTVYHPEQNYRNIQPYPWVIQARGRDCWVRYVTLANPYRGVDFASYPSSGHRIDYLAGSPLVAGLAIGRNDADGWVENVHFNPHYWYRSGFPDAPSSAWQKVWQYQKENLDAFIFGDCAHEHVLGIFSFGGRNGLRFVAQDAGGFTGSIIGAGCDGCTYGFAVEQAKDITLVNTEIACLEAQKPVSMVTKASFTGRLRLFNTAIWGTGKGGQLAGKGETLIQQLNLQGDQMEVTGGSLTGTNLFFQSSSEEYVIVRPDVIKVELYGCSSLTKFLIRNEAGKKLTSFGHISQY